MPSFDKIFLNKAPLFLRNFFSSKTGALAFFSSLLIPRLLKFSSKTKALGQKVISYRSAPSPQHNPFESFGHIQESFGAYLRTTKLDSSPVAIERFLKKVKNPLDELDRITVMSLNPAAQIAKKGKMILTLTLTILEAIEDFEQKEFAFALFLGTLNKDVGRIFLSCAFINSLIKAEALIQNEWIPKKLLKDLLPPFNRVKSSAEKEAALKKLLNPTEQSLLALEKFNEALNPKKKSSAK